MLFALAQLVLYAIYYKSPQEIIEARKRKADQQQQGAMMEVVTDATPPNNNGNTLYTDRSHQEGDDDTKQAMQASVAPKCMHLPMIRSPREGMIHSMYIIRCRRLF